MPGHRSQPCAVNASYQVTCQRLNECKSDKPNNSDKRASAGCGEHVKLYIFEAEPYFVVSRLHVSKWGVLLTHILKGATALSWNHECQDAMLAEGSSAVSWEKFELFMHDSFGLLQLATSSVLPMMPWCSLTMAL